MSAEFPRIRYADADGVFIAYEVRGEGVIDLVRVPGMGASLLSQLVDPVSNVFWARLAGFTRFINFDRRGLGLSDPLLVGGAPPLEQQAADILAVMDSVGSAQAALYSGADGGPVAMLFAAMYPDRVRALILNTTWARMFRSDDYPSGLDGNDKEFFANYLREHWGDLEHPWGEEWISPSRRAEPGFRETLAAGQQVSASKSAAIAAFLNNDNDVREVLPLVQAPTLVLCSPTDVANVGHSEFLARHIPNAHLTQTAGLGMLGGTNMDELAELIEEFLTGTRPEPISNRVLATVLFTDIVGSTGRASALGDHEWRKLLDLHDSIVRDQLAQFKGHEVSTTGDGFFATFDGPARAIDCAKAIIANATAVGLELRTGVHTGECEVRGDDYAGIAVHIGARVAALAGAGEILTTRTVKDLVTGSGIDFEDLGDKTLKGIAEPWHIYRVTSSTASRARCAARRSHDDTPPPERTTLLPGVRRGSSPGRDSPKLRKYEECDANHRRDVHTLIADGTVESFRSRCRSLGRGLFAGRDSVGIAPRPHAARCCSFIRRKLRHGTEGPPVLGRGPRRQSAGDPPGAPRRGSRVGEDP